MADDLEVLPRHRLASCSQDVAIRPRPGLPERGEHRNGGPLTFGRRGRSSLIGPNQRRNDAIPARRCEADDRSRTRDLRLGSQRTTACHSQMQGTCSQDVANIARRVSATACNTGNTDTTNKKNRSRSMRASTQRRIGRSRSELRQRTLQLQTRQRPALQEHAGESAPTRRGPQRRTHSRAVGSLRSPAPPGQQRRSIVAMSRSLSISGRVEIASMCASICGSRERSDMSTTCSPRRRM